MSTVSVLSMETHNLRVLINRYVRGFIGWWRSQWHSRGMSQLRPSGGPWKNSSSYTIYGVPEKEHSTQPDLDVLSIIGDTPWTWLSTGTGAALSKEPSEVLGNRSVDSGTSEIQFISVFSGKSPEAVSNVGP